MNLNLSKSQSEVTGELPPKISELVQHISLKIFDEKSGVSNSQDSNPWLRGEKRERFLCAMPPPSPIKMTFLK